MQSAVLRAVATWLGQLLLAESGIDQLVSARERAEFVKKACGAHSVAALLLVTVLGTMKLVCVAVRCVPALADDRRAMRAGSAALTAACALETAVALLAGDATDAVASALLGAVSAQALLHHCSSRHTRTRAGIVDTESPLADGATSALRACATRYKLRAQATWAIAGILAYAWSCHGSLRAATPLARALAWQEARCAAAAVALVASVGAADERAEARWGRKKDL